MHADQFLVDFIARSRTATAGNERRRRLTAIAVIAALTAVELVAAFCLGHPTGDIALQPF